MNELKLEIAKLVAEQIALKPQRKTVYFTGTRTVEPDVATYKVGDNKDTLRHLYIVYGMLRNKTLDQVEPKRKTEPNKKLIEKLMERFKPVEELIQ